MLTVTIEITGRTHTDIENGIAEARKRISQGNIVGGDSGEDGSFWFAVDGEEEEPSDE